MPLPTTARAITGAGSGLGRDIALGLATKGTWSSARRCRRWRSMTLSMPQAVVLALPSVTSPWSHAVKHGLCVSEALGEAGLDLLISNAGILTPGSTETLPHDSIRREFDVNVFGALSVVNALVPGRLATTSGPM
jgi:NADP-dependent 3-hydroxy acid dehydrogenase YdfG